MDNIDLTPIIDSAKNGQWLLFAGALLTALVAIARKVLPLVKKIPKRVLPWVVVALGVLGGGGTVLAAGGGWQAAIVAGVTAGLTALGAYDLAKGPTERLLGGGGATPGSEPPSSSESNGSK